MAQSGFSEAYNKWLALMPRECTSWNKRWFAWMDQNPVEHASLVAKFAAEKMEWWTARSQAGGATTADMKAKCNVLAGRYNGLIGATDYESETTRFYAVNEIVFLLANVAAVPVIAGSNNPDMGLDWTLPNWDGPPQEEIPDTELSDEDDDLFWEAQGDPDAPVIQEIFAKGQISVPGGQGPKSHFRLVMRSTSLEEDGHIRSKFHIVWAGGDEEWLTRTELIMLYSSTR